MTIRYQCPQCDAVMKIKDELAGTKAKCPKCKALFFIPVWEREPGTKSADADPSAESAPVAAPEGGSVARTPLPATTSPSPSPVPSSLPLSPESETVAAADKPGTVGPARTRSGRGSAAPPLTAGSAPLAEADDEPLSMDDSSPELSTAVASRLWNSGLSSDSSTEIDTLSGSSTELAALTGSSAEMPIISGPVADRAPGSGSVRAERDDGPLSDAEIPSGSGTAAVAASRGAAAASTETSRSGDARGADRSSSAAGTTSKKPIENSITVWMPESLDVRLAIPPSLLRAQKPAAAAVDEEESDPFAPLGNEETPPPVTLAKAAPSKPPSPTGKSASRSLGDSDASVDALGSFTPVPTLRGGPRESGSRRGSNPFEANPFEDSPDETPLPARRSSASSTPAPPTRSAYVDPRFESPSGGGATKSRSSSVGGSAGGNASGRAKELLAMAREEARTATPERPTDDYGDGYDWQGMFREIGLKGGGILVGGVIAAVGLYWLFDRMMGSPLKLPPLGRVTGTVTLDGQPLAGAMVYFSPQDAVIADAKKDRPRTSVGITDEQGFYRMKYLDDLDGVAAGNNRIWLSHIGPKGQSIPPDYQDGSPQYRQVEEKSQTFDFQLRSGR
jgi:phage FluMu protein Com